MKALIDRSVEHGVKHVTMGMPHRGRLNVLANVIRKPIEAILNEFSGTADPDDWPAGDVKYHLGANYVRPTPSGKRVSLSLVANPSHLEAADPVVLGKTRGIQHFEHDERNHTTAMGVLLHGDAAFAGQGVVYETMGFHNLPNYGTGGTIHLIVNNQIGFTTDPRFSRSTAYPSDIAKCIDAPIFHVNGDNVEAVTFVCQLAADYRAKFKTDVVIDIVCYRRYGHNETDQPSFTQPRMYKAIQKQPTPLTKYTKFLIDRGTFTDKDIEEHRKWVWGMLEKAAAAAKDYKPTSKEWLSASWQGFPSPKELAENPLPTRATGTSEEVLKRVERPSRRSPRTLLSIVTSLVFSQPVARRWRKGTTSIGLRLRRSHSVHWCWRTPTFAFLGKTWNAGHSLSVMPSSTTKKTSSSTFLLTTSVPTKPGSSYVIPHSLNSAPWALSWVTHWYRLTASPSGKRSSVTSRTTLNASSTNSLLPVNESGCKELDLS